MSHHSMRATALLAALALAGCAGAGTGDRAAYDQSIRQTAVFTKAAVLPLTPLSYPVQAASLTNYASSWAAGKEGQTVALGRDTWITVEPELKALCRGTPPERVIDQLHKLLGLKPAVPADAEGKFVLMTIAGPQRTGPAGIGVFRPCANPDPAATSCGNTLAGPEAFTRWFAETLISSYKLDPAIEGSGYPWTRLGYTYDWDPAASSPRGAQEYVVPKGTRVVIRKIVPAQEYCR
ncbi:MAG: hypothetical protein WCO00_14435 [Rhodospirillaceae bacterium]